MSKNDDYNGWNFLSDNILWIAMIVWIICAFAPDIIKAFKG